MRLSTLSFDAPEHLLALFAIAFTALYLVWRRKTDRDPVLRFSSTRLTVGLPRTLWVRIAWLPDALRLAALAIIALALARPQVVGAEAAEDTEGIDIVLALDTSCSMRAADFQPSDRMHVAKQSIEGFVRARKMDRMGLVVFAGEAASWVPLTLDYSLLVELLGEVEVGMLPDGTAIGSALGTALNRLRESDAKSRVVVLLTDGDNNAGNISPKKAAEFAKELGVRVYTILIGRGGPVPFPAGKDIFGRVVYREQVVPIDPELLREIARATGGEAYEAKDGAELDERLVAVLDTLERTRLEDAAYAAPRTELFPHFVLAGLLVMAFELLLRSTRLGRYP